MVIGEKKLWLGELFAASSIRRQMIGTIESTDEELAAGKIKLSYVMTLDLDRMPSRDGKKIENHWGMTPDPAIFSASPSDINPGMFLLTKVLDPVEDKTVITQYHNMTQEIRAQKSGLVTAPRSPVMPNK